MRPHLLILLLLFPLLCTAQHDSRWRVARSTDALCFAPAATGLVVSLVKKDYKGLLQLAEAEGASLAANYLLELCVKKDRPDGTGHHAFPSTHCAVSFTGAAFLWHRYGWQYGLPAAALSGYVAWGRCYAKKHDGWDVAAGAVIGIASGWLLSKPFAQKHNLTVAPVTYEGGGAGLYLSGTF